MPARRATLRGGLPPRVASTSEDSVHIAVASNETSTTPPDPGALPLEQGRRDPERQRHRAVAVAHRAALPDRVVEIGRRQHVRQAAAGEEGRRVVAGLIRIRPAHAIAVPAGKDQTREAITHVLASSPSRSKRFGPQVGQEDVSRFEQPLQCGLPLLADVERSDRLPRLASAIDRLTPALARTDALASRGRDTDRPARARRG